jgi:hypothetical protein
MAKIATVEKLVEDAADDRTPAAVLSCIALVIHPFEFLKVVLHAGIEIRSP